MFRDRQEAGRALASELAKHKLHEPVILALPRGGVPVAAEIADALHAPLDLVIVRKVGAPGNPELAAAAIVDGDPPYVVLNRDVVEALGLDEEELEALIESERPELERRRMAYLGNRQRIPVTGKTVILVDDGAATGASMKVAVRAIRNLAPREIVIALPVAPLETVHMLSHEADQVVCIDRPLYFRALGDHYLDFRQLADEEVVAALQLTAADGEVGRVRGEGKGDGP
ncbi:phosphoribosyltransferase [Chelativorans xinjiangense]|uniref:phosphoribosyltransferase n=1 Tax=Chelativorans xinjiangense TaxID=2681485 RepID=UPI00135829B2|nr:phosphoribosyltransferase [Chelativorans xinjiangense]